MNILILDKNKNFGEEAAEPWKFRLLKEWHNVNYSSGLRNERNNLSEYDFVIAHPQKEDLPSLYAEANKRKDFKLIFFRIDTLPKGVNPNERFPNKNVFFRGFPTPSELVELIQSTD